MNVFEIRTEEELVGNVLWMILDHEDEDEELILKKMWIEIQDYSTNNSEELKNNEFIYAKNKFKYSTQSLIDYKKRVNTFMAKVLSSEIAYGLLSNRPIEMPKIEFPELDSNMRVKILEDDFSDYMAFLVNKEKAMLFCWTDVV